MMRDDNIGVITSSIHLNYLEEIDTNPLPMSMTDHMPLSWSALYFADDEEQDEGLYVPPTPAYDADGNPIQAPEEDHRDPTPDTCHDPVYDPLMDTESRIYLRWRPDGYTHWCRPVVCEGKLIWTIPTPTTGADRAVVKSSGARYDKGRTRWYFDDPSLFQPYVVPCKDTPDDIMHRLLSRAGF